ncbi:MAG: major capsid protein [Candidatus Sedimenticola sp. (ex Thyasira tokunagai)]
MNKLVRFGKWVAAGAASLGASAAMALDTTAVGTAITGAKTDALAVGDMVIGAVAALVVVGIVLTIIKKL